MTTSSTSQGWASLAASSGSVPERLGDRLARMIRRGELPDGARIPGERELSEMAGISRTSVREALRDLELQGLIDRRPGRGTVVLGHDRPVLDAGLAGDLIGPGGATDLVVREVMDLRAAIEPPVARRAAARASSDEVDELRALVEQAEAHLAGPSPDRATLVSLDVEFHVALARLTHNPLLERLLTVTNEWMAPARSTGLQTSRRVTRSVAAHRLVFEAVSAHDADRAHAAMAAHIQEVFEAVSGDGPA